MDLEAVALHTLAVVGVYLVLAALLIVGGVVLIATTRTRRRNLHARNRQVMHGEFDVHSE